MLRLVCCLMLAAATGLVGGVLGQDVLAATAEEHNIVEQGFVRYRTKLRAEANFRSDKLQSLNIGSKVDILGKQRGWVHIRLQDTPDTDGWVRFSRIRTVPGPAQGVSTTADTADEPSKSSGGLSGLARGITGWLGGGSGRKSRQGGATSTIGIRGLNPDDLKTARANPAQLKRLHGHQVSAAAAEQFAGELDLHAQSLSYLGED